MRANNTTLELQFDALKRAAEKLGNSVAREWVLVPAAPDRQSPWLIGTQDGERVIILGSTRRDAFVSLSAMTGILDVLS